MEIAEVFGYLGTATGATCLLPQLYKTWKTKSVEDISWGMLVLLLLNSVFWFMAGFFDSSLPLLLTNGFVFWVMVVQIALKFLYRNNP